MTRITIETEWGVSDDSKVVVEVNDDDLDISQMLQLMKQALNGCGYADINVYDGFKYMVEAYKHLEREDA